VAFFFANLSPPGGAEQPAADAIKLGMDVIGAVLPGMSRVALRGYTTALILGLGTMILAVAADRLWRLVQRRRR